MLPVFARDVLGVGAGGYGALLAAVGAGATTAALGIAALGSRVRQAARGNDPDRGSAAVLGGALVALALVPWLPLTLLVCVLAGCAMASAGITTNTLLQRLSPDHLRGRVMGFYSFVALGMAPLGSLQAGWVAEHFGVRAAFAVGGTACVLAVALVVWRFEADRKAEVAAAAPARETASPLVTNPAAGDPAPQSGPGTARPS